MDPPRHVGTSGVSRPHAATPRHVRLLAQAIASAVTALAVSLATLASAEPRSGGAKEYDLKAAFLFHFAHFVDWPAEAFPGAYAPFTVGVLGDDPFGKSLEDIVAGDSVGGRPLVVRRLRTVEEADGCQMLFVSASEAGRFDEVSARVRGRSVLTVGDTKDFARRYGVVGFVSTQNRVRLQINLAAATAARLRVSSKLLRQSEIVGPERTVR